MACLEMYNNNNSSPSDPNNPKSFFSAPPVSPRISFSNDFAESSHYAATPKPPPSLGITTGGAATSSDFEFSVSNHSMMSADELFCKGRMLPFKDSGGRKPTTLREELLAGDEDDDDVALRPPKGSGSMRWKGFLGLRKAHIGSKKVEPKQPPSLLGQDNMQTKETMDEGVSSCGDMEMRM